MREAFARLQFQMMAGLAEFERALIKKRWREAIEKARLKGDVYRGRAPTIDRQAVLDRLDRGEPRPRSRASWAFRVLVVPSRIIT